MRTLSIIIFGHMKTLHKINIEIERAGMIMSQFTVTIQYGIVFLH